MKTIISLTVGEIASQLPESQTIFEKYHIDYCCGGKQTLLAACEVRNIPVEKVLNELQSIDNEKIGGGNPVQLPPLELIEYIQDKHHQYIRSAGPVIMEMFDKVVQKHAGEYPFLSNLSSLFYELHVDLLQHMLKEEKVLFPAIRQLMGAGKPDDLKIPEGMKLDFPVNNMELEHDRAGRLMEEMRKVSDNYRLPEDSCITWQNLYRHIDAFEKDLHRHVHLENNVLFPFAIFVEV
ncbi:MAG: iron-sulfur cluster repair di-iron protein [Bacteroidetes bacterium]|nr:iron-sulfur cluster repair di-iron protein [Bacteroidota bacterium]